MNRVHKWLVKATISTRYTGFPKIIDYYWRFIKGLRRIISSLIYILKNMIRLVLNSIVNKLNLKNRCDIEHEVYIRAKKCNKRKKKPGRARFLFFIAKIVFINMKWAFITTLILCHFFSKCHIYIKITIFHYIYKKIWSKLFLKTWVICIRWFFSREK